MAKRLTAISGVGPLTAAAVLATVSDARDFKNGRQFAAWQGVVPRQDSSGGKTRLGHLTKRGDTYLRGLLTQGARSALQAALTKEPLRRTRLQSWIVQLQARVGYHKTLVAIANKLEPSLVCIVRVRDSLGLRSAVVQGLDDTRGACEG